MSLPPLPLPTGSVIRSLSTVPAMAEATTNGGLARKLALRLGWMRASKLRLPDSTAAHTRSLLVMASFSSGVRSPALPIQVVQPMALAPLPERPHRQEHHWHGHGGACAASRPGG